MDTENPTPNDNRPFRNTFVIQIDRKRYKWSDKVITGSQIRRLAQPPIPPERDLFKIVRVGSDQKIGDNDEVPVHDGLRFFTAPSTINPGICCANQRISQPPP